jgi:hypothetical protein
MRWARYRMPGESVSTRWRGAKNLIAERIYLVHGVNVKQNPSRTGKDSIDKTMDWDGNPWPAIMPGVLTPQWSPMQLVQHAKWLQSEIRSQQGMLPQAG